MATNVLILGVGGTGSRAVDMLQKKIDRMGKREDTKIVTIVFDTDTKDMENLTSAIGIPLSSHALVGQIKERLGQSTWGDFFPPDQKFDKNDPDKGAGQWRKQSYLALLDLLKDTVRKQRLQSALGELDLSGDSPSVLIYTVASLAGGTGSGSFIPLTLYIKKTIGQMCTGANVQARAMLACPDIYQKALEDNPPQLRSVFANAYAILRELNAINQVVYGKNKREYDNAITGEASAGRTPVRFRLGNVDSPTGVLFDSLDPAYHTPSAAPFESVCLLEKINGIDSIPAHDEVMANILYSLICTEVGASLNSYLSNEEKGRAGNIGYNRMYSAFATSEIVYPVEEMLEYFAWRKTREDAAGAWLTLHIATQKQIEERKKKAIAARRHYTLTTGDYAEIFLDQQKAEERARTSTITEIIQEGTVRYDKNGDEETPVLLLDEYWEALKEELLEIVPEHKTYANKISTQLAEEVKNPGLFGGSRKADCALQVCEYAKKGYSYLNEYYRFATKEIGDNRDLTADAILPLDLKKDVGANPKLSFVDNILKQNGKYIHPVAAMVQLCSFRQLINNELEELSGNLWKEIGAYEIGKIPTNLLNCTEDLDKLDLGKRVKKSNYVQMGASRLSSLLTESGKATYTESSTDYAADSVAVRKDCDIILTRLNNEAGDMIKREVLGRIAERVDKLIESYRVFFGRFDEQRKELDKKVLKAEEEKSKEVDSTSIYVGASVARRREHYDNMMMEAAFDEAASNDVAGIAVFETAYAMACAKVGSAGKEDRVDVSAVFEKMYKENKAQIDEIPYCLTLKDKDIIRAIAEENEDNEADAVSDAVRTCYNLAKPALRIREREGAAIQRGFLILDKSVESYLEDNKATFGIKPEINSHFASALLGKTCSDTSVTTTDTDNKNVAFLCRATLCVEPSDIVKVNELSGEDGYYKRYLAAIAYAEKDDNDSWLPHLGFNWHKRGYLPYINPELERAADVKFVKALLYAIMENQISFATIYGGGATRFRYNSSDIYLPAANGDARYADENHLLVLIDWLRPQEDLINMWAEKFDRDVDQQMADVPVVNYEGDVGEAKTRLTSTKYLKMLRRNIFEKMLESSSGSAQTTLKNQLNLSLFEFAKKIQSEEQARDGFDCNDAEKFLKVASDLLWDLCARAADPKTDLFGNIYQWELGYFVAEMYDDNDIGARNVDENVNALFQMANRAGCFMDIVRNGDGWKQVNFVLNEFKSSGKLDSFLRKVQENKNPGAKRTDKPETPAETPVEAPAAPSEPTEN